MSFDMKPTIIGSCSTLERLSGSMNLMPQRTTLSEARQLLCIQSKMSVPPPINANSGLLSLLLSLLLCLAQNSPTTIRVVRIR
jgi:hypothetical protein